MADFTQATMTIGYPGNIKALYRALAKEDGQDFVTLRDIDADLATALDAFGEIISSTYGSFKEAWTSRLDINQLGHVDESVFVEFCSEIGYRRNAKALFKIFNPVAGRSCLFFEDFGYLALPPGTKSPTRNREPQAAWRRREMPGDPPRSPTPSPMRSPPTQCDGKSSGQCDGQHDAAGQDVHNCLAAVQNRRSRRKDNNITAFGFSSV
jgi:hypothetical protein